MQNMYIIPHSRGGGYLFVNQTFCFNVALVLAGLLCTVALTGENGQDFFHEYVVAFVRSVFEAEEHCLIFFICLGFTAYIC